MPFWVQLITIALILLWFWQKYKEQQSKPERADPSLGGKPHPAISRRLANGTASNGEPEESEWLKPDSEEKATRDARQQHEREARAAYEARMANPAKPVDEEITVVMRKQIPPRDEPPRSWIGGLPMMPDDVEWPRGINPERSDDGEVPLHFICQIALSDLPENLWDGHGPREGWLLLFVNNNSCDLGDDGLTRFIYTRELGRERQPPDDICVVHDGSYTDATDWKRRETTYPHFSVDLVSLPDRLYERDGHQYASPENLEALLYADEAVGENRPFRQISEPFSWRCIALSIEKALAAMDDERVKANSERYKAKMVEKVRVPGALEHIISDKQAQVEMWLDARNNRELVNADPATLSEQELSVVKHVTEMRADIGETHALLTSYPDAESLLTFLESDSREQWLAELRPGLQSLNNLAEERGLDTPLSTEDWAAIKVELATADKAIWALGWGHSRERGLPVTVKKEALAAIEILKNNMTAVCADVAKLYYTDPARRGLIPEADLPALEAHYRSIYDNRPQRMGGYHDGVQSEDDIKLPDSVLLLQLSCDYALEMLWGDCGAIYAYISPADLDACAFDKASLHLECG
ncbi:DUF1963 domain-containing protein [Altererythrobacter sp.]|uniref:DUF1963 domain-containing protein n=1 Tax=Altererythrobacter sp. TaxID=1872480 RepID=UPI003D00F36B